VEIGKEKAVMVPVSTLGLLMAIAMGAEWKTESTKGVAAAILDGTPVAKKRAAGLYGSVQRSGDGCSWLW
jgi:hypothetical protein